MIDNPLFLQTFNYPLSILNFQFQISISFLDKVKEQPSPNKVFVYDLPSLQKGGVPATPSGTATLLRLNPSHRFYPRTLLAVAYFRSPQLPWFDGRCVQGPGTYSPRHG